MVRRLLLDHFLVEETRIAYMHPSGPAFRSLQSESFPEQMQLPEQQHRLPQQLFELELQPERLARLRPLLLQQPGQQLLLRFRL